MENKLVVGILNILEDKLREFGVQLPAEDREDSQDPIVGYHYAELHDRIQEYLEEQGLLQGRDGITEPVKQAEDLRKVCVLTCIHETRHGVSVYGSVHATSKEALDYVETVKEQCDFEEDVAGEYFDADLDFDEIDVSKLEKVAVKEIQRATTSLDEQIETASFLKEKQGPNAEKSAFVHEKGDNNERV